MIDKVGLMRLLGDVEYAPRTEQVVIAEMAIFKAFDELEAENVRLREENKRLSEIPHQQDLLYMEAYKNYNTWKADYERLREASAWVPVGERLPGKDYEDIGDEVIVMLAYPYDRVAPMHFSNREGEGQFYTGGFGTVLTDWTRHVICWQPLPALLLQKHDLLLTQGV